jgi:hypothetical protein
MFESVVAVSVATVAGAALLSSLGAAVRSSSEAALFAMARGMAEQLMDEIASVRFPESSNSPPLGTTRENFDDIDDYDGWSASPPTGRTGQALGTQGATVSGVIQNRSSGLIADADSIAHFTQEVVVQRIEPDAGTGWTVVTPHTNHRRVTVRVKYTDGQANTRTLAEITRVFSYVPVAP